VGLQPFDELPDDAAERHRGFDVVTGDVERLAGRKPRALRELLAGAFSGG
jgi:hypothetical protein